jgi:hypothetical protein
MKASPQGPAMVRPGAARLLEPALSQSSAVPVRSEGKRDRPVHMSLPNATMVGATAGPRPAVSASSSP